jgi:hypothetical protein
MISVGPLPAINTPSRYQLQTAVAGKLVVSVAPAGVHKPPVFTMVVIPELVTVTAQVIVPMQEVACKISTLGLNAAPCHNTCTWFVP